MNRPKQLLAFALTVCAGAFGAVRAADEPKRPWTDTADFGFALTTGNTQSTNFSLGNKFKYSWSNAELTFDAIALRNANTTTTFTNIDGTVTETESTATTAALYGLALKYRQNITPRFYWFVGSSWYQNFFAGIDDRYIAGGGLGYAFVQEPRHLLRGEAGLDYTLEDPLGVPPNDLENEDYVSLHLFLGYEFKISETAKLTEDLHLFENLENTSDFRATSVTAVTASLTSKLAIKVSYTVAYDNEPAVSLVPDTVGPAFTDVLVPFEKTDMILQAALVVNF